MNVNNYNDQTSGVGISYCKYSIYNIVTKNCTSLVYIRLEVKTFSLKGLTPEIAEIIFAIITDTESH